ncbi:hydrolase [Paenibacillus pini JCM 16418]|uniref:Hydrolase n=1 Tax=Paenibacillus pini JCM 16418 TaxID=1236976 RepID=W7YQR8_9BACL|nr:hydrolase [Paenibacillus pini JCM 16418]
MPIWLSVVLVVAALFFGFVIGYFIRKSLAEAKISSAEEAAVQIVESAKKEAEAQKKETVLEVRTKSTESGLKLKRTLVSVGMKFNDKKDDCCKKKSRWIKKLNR